MISSSSSSPLRKKPRLSSPTYEDEFDMLDGEDFRTLDEIEHTLSQSLGPSSMAKEFREHDTPHTSVLCGEATVTARPPYDERSQASSSKKLLQESLPLNAHTVYQHLIDDTRPSSPEEVDERSYDAWFLPSKEDLPAVFALASVLVDKAKAPTQKEVIAELSNGKERLQAPWSTIPHPKSIELAKKKIHAWEQESENRTELSDTIISTQLNMTDRKPFRNVQNSTADQNSDPTFQQVPQLSKPLEHSFTSSLLSRISEVPPIFSSPNHSGPSTPSRAPAPLSSQKFKSLGLTPHARVYAPRSKFKTPFKTQLLPDNLHQLKSLSNISDVVPSTPDETRSIKSVSKRPTLATCGLVPQTYDWEELDAMGVPSSLFTLEYISDFLYYRFNPKPLDAQAESSLGADSALGELQNRACHLATKAWVDNHWCLILWKLSGMACLDPEKLTVIWCWGEVMRQLHYRYEKELAGSSRPALSVITARDTSIRRPLVLCVTKISWLSQTSNSIAQSKNIYPELELTDGWYRIQAKVDHVLARAIQHKIIRTGRKLICICSGLETPKNEPIDILNSYGRAHLFLNGNSTHLAPWHTRLGFHKTRCIATLHSLSPEGGRVPIMDLVVTNVYPIGYIELIPTADGDVRVGPRSEAEEACEEEIWKNKRAQEALRLQETLERKLEKLESYADILERRANVVVLPSELDSAPSHLESIVDDWVEECANVAPILQEVDRAEAGWLSLLLRQRCSTEREQANISIEAELEASVPPRQIMSFRILRVKDARTLKRAPNRTAQLTVWDVATLQNSSNAISPGQRYMVSNLMPRQHNAWMSTNEPGAEIFLSTGKDSKWQLVN